MSACTCECVQMRVNECQGECGTKQGLVWVVCKSTGALVWRGRVVTCLVGVCEHLCVCVRSHVSSYNLPPSYCNPTERYHKKPRSPPSLDFDLSGKTATLGPASNVSGRSHGGSYSVGAQFLSHSWQGDLRCLQHG